MKRLYLIRHAKSTWDCDWLDDFERPLNQRGKRDAPAMAMILRDLGLSPGAFFTSPAARTSATARIVAQTFDFPLDRVQYVESLYEALTRDIVAVVESVDDDVDEAVVVGHNPGVTTFANRYAGAGVDNVPTMGAIGIAFRSETWSNFTEHGAEMLFFEYPKKHRS